MEILNKVNWKRPYSLTDNNLDYEYFPRTFSGLYDHAFPIKEVSLKLKNVFNPWMAKGLQKSSKRNRNFMINFLNSKLTKMKRNIRHINLYSKFLNKILKKFITRESSKTVSKT